MALTNYGKLLKIAASAGVLSDYVKKKLNPGTGKEVGEDMKKLVGTPGAFRKKLLEMKPGPERQKFILDAALAKGKPNTVPVSIPLPDGGKMTYWVMPSYLSVDGVNLPISAEDNQRLADAWGMVLPTNKIITQVYQNASKKIDPRPLSAGGRIGDKTYSGEEVVKHKISDSDSAVQYSDNFNKALGDDKDGIISGYYKEISQPNKDGKVSIYGLFDKGKPIQNGLNTSHTTTKDPSGYAHTEYAMVSRLLNDKVEIETADGKKIRTTMEEVMSDPKWSGLVSDTPGGMKRY